MSEHIDAFCFELRGPHCYCRRTLPPTCCGCGQKVTVIATPKQMPGLNCVHNHNGQACGLCTPWKPPPPSEPIDIQKERSNFLYKMNTLVCQGATCWNQRAPDSVFCSDCKLG